jgi:cobalt-zinc-cadmium efflux system membrane fusion protein
MIRNSIVIFIILVATYIVAQQLISKPKVISGSEMDHDDESSHDDEILRGPNGGRLVKEGDLSLEISIYEAGIPPEFHVYPYYQDNELDPTRIELGITLYRTGNVQDTFEFEPASNFLRGKGVVREPHSFDVLVTASYQGKNYRWSYENHEGRTEIPSDIAKQAGVKTEIAGPVVMSETLNVTGRIQIDPNRLSHVRPRFPGRILTVNKKLGDQVKKGETLLSLQNNESLQDYKVMAPISGMITHRNVQVGESTGSEPLYTITDLSRVWVELDIFSSDLSKVSQGDSVTIETLDGRQKTGQINWILPLATHASQSVQAVVQLDNADNQLRPGQFVRGMIQVAENEIDLAVKQSAIQSFRDFQVVYAQFGDTYEVRMLETGRANSEWVEILGGLDPGTEYVTENSYLIKADIEKSGASHDH